MPSLPVPINGSNRMRMVDEPIRRVRNAAATKARILAAATATFSELGYAGAGLREIASRAGVAQSLLARHFGSKASLFEATLLETLRQNTVFTGEKSNFGPTMASLMVERSTANISIMLILALAHPESQEIARGVANEHMIGPLAEWLGPPDAKARAINMLALMSGFVVQTKGLASERVPETSIRWLAASLQAIVDDA
jgi:AcrR family transcriptional regulator